MHTECTDFFPRARCPVAKPRLSGDRSFSAPTFTQCIFQGAHEIAYDMMTCNACLVVLSSEGWPRMRKEQPRLAFHTGGD